MAARPGEIVSFKIDKDDAKAARKDAFERRIPLSLWLREAARDKIKRMKKGSR